MMDLDEKTEYRQYFKAFFAKSNSKEYEKAFKAKCSICKEDLKFDIDNNYSNMLQEFYVPCPNGTPNDGHGFFASVIKLVLN